MFCWQCLTTLSNVGDVGIVASIDGAVVVVEGGRAVAAVSRVVVVVDVDVCGLSSMVWKPWEW
jgi:hypothetical protein